MEGIKVSKITVTEQGNVEISFDISDEFRRNLEELFGNEYQGKLSEIIKELTKKEWEKIMSMTPEQLEEYSRYLEVVNG